MCFCTSDEGVLETGWVGGNQLVAGNRCVCNIDCATVDPTAELRGRRIEDQLGQEGGLSKKRKSVQESFP